MSYPEALQILTVLNSSLATTISDAKVLRQSNHFFEALEFLQAAKELHAQKIVEAHQHYPRHNLILAKLKDAAELLIDEITNLQSVYSEAQAAHPTSLDENEGELVGVQSSSSSVDTPRFHQVIPSIIASVQILSSATSDTSSQVVTSIEKDPLQLARFDELVLNPELQQQVAIFRAQLLHLFATDPASAPTLIEASDKTFALLQDHADADDYVAFAKDMQGKSSPAMQILGGIMLTLSVLAAVVALTLTTTIVGAGVMATTSGTLALASAGFFSLGRTQGLSKAMLDIENTLAAPENMGFSEVVSSSLL